MPSLHFHKYQGTGNDFILIDDREESFPADDLKLVRALCDRRFGIGADGLILIRNHKKADFEMIYFNSDGSQSLCGNGSRCALKFAETLKMAGENATFMAIDGLHTGRIQEEMIHIKMHDVSEIKFLNGDVFLNTGSPHFIRYVKGLADYPVEKEGHAIRYSDPYVGSGGTNVNFVEMVDESTLFVRTYERGVEAETLSCGTGVTAVSLAAGNQGMKSPVTIKTPGGTLQVSFEIKEDGSFSEIFLSGPAQHVFSGDYDYSSQI